MASRAKNIFNFDEMGMPQSDREFFDRLDRNTAAQRAEAEKQQGGNRKNFEKTVDWNNPENLKLYLQKELEVDIMMIDKKISDLILDRKTTTTHEAKQLREEIYILELRREELYAEMEQLRIYNGMKAATIQPQNKVYEARTIYQDRNIEQSADDEGNGINYNYENYGVNE